MPDAAPLHWLLLRGLVRERRHWGDFPARLAARTGGDVLALDLPGVGTERERPSPTSLAAIVADLRERFVSHRERNGGGERRGDRAGRWGLFAPSLGGMIALAWAEAWPDDFAHVAVCNTSARDLAGLFERFSPEALRTVARGLLASGVTRERHILALVSNTAHGPAHAEAFAAYAREAPIGPDVLVRQLLAASRATAPATLAVPLLVLCSDGDRLCSPRASQALAARLGAPIHVHSGGGHDLPLDDPDWVIARLAEVGLGSDVAAR
jgi:alpha-beta hydrolase superfamily lysophospholipase